MFTRGNQLILSIFFECKHSIARHCFIEPFHEAFAVMTRIHDMTFHVMFSA
jgi:hypothetical protein